MDYQQALDYIYSYIDYETMHLPRDAANYDLRRMDELLALVGNPHLSAKSVHIAGTNGKGSIASMVTSALKESGYATGLYTSPHLITLNERIKFNDELIANEELVSLVEALKPHIEAVDKKASYGHLTTFEILTVLAFYYFARKKADFQVLEVGLGGRLDATNVITPELSVISPISLDHMEVLGDSLAKIAAEKAGIIKPGAPVVVSPQPPEAMAVIEEKCRALGSELIKVGTDITWQGLGFTGGRQRLTVRGRRDSYELAIPLLGRYQLENSATAVAALEVLAARGFHISRESIVSGLANVSWPGRLQVLKEHPLLLVDGAHNTEAVHSLKQAIEDYFRFERAILVLGMSFDRDMSTVVAELLPLFDIVIATRSRHPRAMEAGALSSALLSRGVRAELAEDVPSALSRALELAGEKDLICAAGSLFIAAEVLEQKGKLF